MTPIMKARKFVMMLTALHKSITATSRAVVGPAVAGLALAAQTAGATSMLTRDLWIHPMETCA